MGKPEIGAMAVEAPLLILRIWVDTTSELLSQLLQSMTVRRAWSDGNTVHDLSYITASEDTRGHTALLYTGHSDFAGTTYPAAVWYALDDYPPPAVRVLLTLSARLHGQTVLDHVYDALKMLRESYLNISVELAEAPAMFTDRNEALPDVFDFQIKSVVPLRRQPIEPVSIAPTYEPPAANAAQPAPWLPLSGTPTREEFTNWEELQRERLFWLVTQTTPAAGTAQEGTQNEVSQPFVGRWADAVTELANDGTDATDPEQEAIDARFKMLWANDDITKTDIAQEMGYGLDWVNTKAFVLRLPRRKRGRKKKK